MASKKSKVTVKWPKMTQQEWEVLMRAVEWHEAEEVLERGFPRATCSGPERFWMNQRVKAKDELFKAIGELKRVNPSWRPRQGEVG